MNLEAQPAIYSWYRSLKLQDAIQTPEAFISRINNLLSARLSDVHLGRLGYLYEIRINEHSGNLTSRSKDLLYRISENPIARKWLAKNLEEASLLQSPLYIGKTLDLRRRIGQHMSGSSGLLTRLKDAGIPIQTCIVQFKYISIKEVPELFPTQNSTEIENEEKERSKDFNNTVLLVEELLTRLSPAAFVRKPG